MNNRLCRYNCGKPNALNCSAADCEVRAMLKDIDEREWRAKIQRHNVMFGDGIPFADKVKMFTKPGKETTMAKIPEKLKLQGPPGVNDWCEDMSLAPRDGTMLLLIVDCYANDEGTEFYKTPTEDKRYFRTMGHNGFENDGIDRWLFSGWSWDQDEYTQGSGRPVAWRVYPAVPKRFLDE